MKAITTVLLALLLPTALLAQKSMTKTKKQVISSIDEKADKYGELAQEIWDLAELGFLENESAALLAGALEDEGFKVQRGVAGMPTAFVAEYGSGQPVIGILAEYDALPGMSQAAVPYKEAKEDGASGHACGHHLFGAASTAAAIAIKDWLAESGNSGTIRLYGTPAEEGGGGKVFMVRSGLFDDVDAVLAWHPGSENVSNAKTTLAVMSMNFTFAGKASHAAAAPERGRSALDGVEAMNHMVNLMREHVPMESRIHYTIKYGGGAANVVPAKASVGCIIRHPEMPEVKDLVRRVTLAAEGAATGTETTFTTKVEAGYFNIMPNTTIAKLMYDNLKLVGGVNYTDEEREFAQKISESFVRPSDISEAATIVPYEPEPGLISASTDVGDISWVVPTSSMSVATWVSGTAPHSWQAVAAGGTSIGNKGMIVAAKTMAISAIDIFLDPKIAAEAKKELLDRRGTEFTYESLLGDMDPVLDYRMDR